MGPSRSPQSLSGAVLALLLLAGCAPAVRAQDPPPVDSLVDTFLQRGARSAWLPHALYEGCPDLAPWQERGIDRLMAADLSTGRSDELALAWMVPLRECGDARLERWYFDRLGAAIRAGEAEAELMGFWTALGFADSPAIRHGLRAMMVSHDLPLEARTLAGARLFERLDPAESRREYLRAFASGRLPDQLAWGQTDRELQRDGDGLLADIGPLVADQPGLADQAAFLQILEGAARHASPSARDALGRALQRGLDRPGVLSDEQRRRLETAAAALRRPGS